MTYEVAVERVPESPTAVVRGTTDVAGLPDTIIGLLNQVYAGLGATGAVQTGHNIVFYDLHGPVLKVEVGVQVDKRFDSDGAVVSSAVPAGRVARTLHVGPYGEMHRAHMAIQQWCKANGEEPAGPNWELYGDWNDDESKLETEVFYLLS